MFLLGDQIRELREVIELPLMNPELFHRVGITPPKGCLLYGPPGTGKTDLSRRLLHELGTRIIGIRDPIEAVVSYEWGRYDVNQMMSI